MIRSRFVPALLALVLWCLGLSEALAHPHVFVRARAEVVYDDKGEVVAINHDWQFDDAFSAFALQGLDTNGDGKYSREELAGLAKVNIDSMKEYGYFTFGDDTRVEIDFRHPPDGFWLETKTIPLDDYWGISDDDRKAMAEDKARGVQDDVPDTVTLLELHFTLPLKKPVGHDKPVTFDVYDPTYYVDFRFAGTGMPITLKNPPGKCRVKVKEPDPLDPTTAAALAQVGADVRTPPPDLLAVTQNLVNQMIITCGDKVAAAVSAPGDTSTPGNPSIPGNTGPQASASLLDTPAAAMQAPDAPNAAPDASADVSGTDGVRLENAFDAVNALAASGDAAARQAVADEAASLAEAAESEGEAVRSVDTTRITAAPKTTTTANGAVSAPADPEASPPSSSIGWLARIKGRISQLQSAYYQKMISAMRRFRSSDTAAWGLIWLSLAYGIFHAAGPGHGKAVITSYMFANEATVRRGVTLSFAAAFVQGLTAVLIVSVIALILKGTGMAMRSTLGVFESGSFALVALLGAWLTWRKGRAFLAILGWGAASGHAHNHAHAHGHNHDHTHDHAHNHDHGHNHDHAHDHDHDHVHHALAHSDPHHVHGPDCGCGHNHLPDVELASKKLSLKEALAAILSIGIRPCSGALVVLVFALSLDLYWVGVVSAFVMAFGTALTVSSLAIIAVTSKGIAKRFLGAQGGGGRVLFAGVEVAAAVFVFLVGVTLFIVTFGTAPMV